MKIAISSDWHLYPCIRTKIPEMRGDSFAALQEVFQYVTDNNLSLLCPGDIFDYGDKGGVSTSLAQLSSMLSEYMEKAEHVIFGFIQGNHEEPSRTGVTPNQPWVSSLCHAMEGVHHVGGTVIHHAGIRIGGLDYCRGRAAFLDALAAFRESLDEPLDIFLCHQPLKQLLKFEGAWSASQEDFEGIARVVAIGDVHIPKDWDVTWDDGSTTKFISPGSTVVTNMAETRDKKFPVLDTDTMEVEWVKLRQQREFWDQTAVTTQDQDGLVEAVKTYTPPEYLVEELRRPYIKLRYRPNGDFHQRLFEVAKGRAFIEDTPLPKPSVTGGVAIQKDLSEEHTDETQKAVEIAERHIDKHLHPLAFDIAVAIQLEAGSPEGIVDDAVMDILSGKDHKPVDWSNKDDRGNGNGEQRDGAGSEPAGS